MHKKYFIICWCIICTKGKGGDKLTEAAKEARRAYKRQWARENPDKVKAAQARYWERKAAAEDPPRDPEEPATTGND